MTYKAIGRTAAVLAGAMALSLMTGCAEQKHPGAKTVGIAMPAKSLERWNRDGQYLKQQFEASGYNVELRYSDNDINQQNNDLEVLIADDVDLLIVSAIDGAAIFRTLEDAEYSGIPVIAYDRLIMNTDAVKCYISFDNFSVGEMQAQFVVDQLGLDSASEPKNLEFVSGDTADNNALYFFNGAWSVISQYIDSGRLKVPSGKVSFEQTATPSWSTDVAMENLQNTLASYYTGSTKLDAVIASSDVLSLGVSQAIRSDYTGDFPVITGQDGDIAALRNIVDGYQTMTIFKNVNDEANVTLEVSKALLEGKEIDESLVDVFEAETTYDTESYNNGVKNVPSYLLTPTVITADNLDDLVATGSYKWDSSHKYLEAAN